MLIEIGISLATWLSGKIADKGFDAICEKLKSKDDIDTKFKQCVEDVASKLEKKYPDILGNSISYFFTQEEVFGELIKLLFVNQNVNNDVIAQSFDTSTLPKNFILEFVKELKNRLEQDVIFQELLSNKEIHNALIGVSMNVKEISINSAVTAKEVTAIREILEKRTNVENHNQNEVSVSISAYNNENSYPYVNKEPEFALEYIYNRTENLMSIEPSMPYLKKIKKNGIIKPIHFLWEPFNWNFPSIDFKISNNSGNILYITDVIFKNIKSVIDPSPVLFMHKHLTNANARHIRLFNDGWGAIKNLRIKLSASPVNSDNEIQHSCVEYSHELCIGDITESLNVDISTVLKDYGFISDVKNLEPPLSIKSKIFDYTKVYGEFVFDGISYDNTIKSYTVKFETIVYLYEWNLPAMPLPPSYFYNVKFETDCDNYSITISVSQALKPKEHDRFVVTIGIDKSSYHEFDIELVTNLGTIVLPKTTLLAFVSRFGARFIDDKEKKWRQKLADLAKINLDSEDIKKQYQSLCDNVEKNILMRTTKKKRPACNERFCESGGVCPPELLC